MSARTAVLTVTDLEAGYGSIKVLRGIGFTVPAGKVVALLGGNGAGKTTTMKTIAGIVAATAGQVEFDGRRIEREPSHRIFARGLALVPQGRELFPEMTVIENLELGGLARRSTTEIAAGIAGVFAQFPRLAERAHQRAATLSGGEQQMLATGRALMSRPKLLLLDEPTTGLGPLIVAELIRIVRELNRGGQTILLVEQNVRMALAVADYVYIIRTGEIVAESEAAKLSDRDEMFRSYLG
ncbi:MAG: ABC transporter ATP-binding protein [Alphaproteobacteria bacterium]|nr:ABC transporter ATP-binding protein [Alphaproteobacteria bacterium]